MTDGLREIEVYLEPLILENSLDGGIFTTGSHLGLKDHAEGAIADNLTLGVGDLLGLAGQSILDLLTDDLLRASQFGIWRFSLIITHHPCANSETTRADSVTSRSSL